MKQRRTIQRQAIERAIEQSARPLSVAEILQIGLNVAPSLNLSTVYRNLGLLERQGSIRRIDMPHRGPLFESARKGHHHHFHCLVCNQVFDLPGCALDEVKSTPPGFVIASHEVFLYGVCVDCREP